MEELSLVKIFDFFTLVIVPICAVFIGAALQIHSERRKIKSNLNIELYIIYRTVSERLENIESSIIYEENKIVDLEEKNWKNTLSEWNNYDKPRNKIDLREIASVLDFQKNFIFELDNTSKTTKIESVYYESLGEEELESLQSAFDKMYKFINKRYFKKVQFEKIKIKKYEDIKKEHKMYRKKMHDNAVENINRLESKGIELDGYDKCNLDSKYDGYNNIDEMEERADYDAEYCENSEENLKEQYECRNKYYDYE